MDKTPKTAPGSFKFTGDWNKVSKKLKGKFPKLTDSDLKFETGKEKELITRIETRLGKKREEVISLLKTDH